MDRSVINQGGNSDMFLATQTVCIQEHCLNK